MSSIPKGARQVFKGEIFEVWQWRQKLFDGSHAIFERIKRPASISVLAIWDGKVVVAREQQPDVKPFYGLIAGRVDEGETPLKAAKRELLEEAGLASTDWELIFIDQPSTKIEWKIYFFVARNCRKVAEQKLDPGEKIKILKFTFEIFLKFATSNKLRDREVAHFVTSLMIKKDRISKFQKKLFRK